MDKDAESALQIEEADGTLDEPEESLMVPSVRPTTPSRRSFVGDPVFESGKPDHIATPSQPSHVPTPATPPPVPPEVKKQGPGILKKAFAVLKKRPSQQPKDSILSSAVGFYAAQMTMLAAAVIGGLLAS